MVNKPYHVSEKLEFYHGIPKAKNVVFAYRGHNLYIHYHLHEERWIVGHIPDSWVTRNWHGRLCSPKNCRMVPGYLLWECWQSCSGCSWLSSVIFYFKGNKVLFEIFKVLTTKANLRYNRDEIQYRLFCQSSQPFSSFWLHLGLGNMSCFLELKPK